MSYRSDQIEEKARKAFDFAKNFPRKHPVFALILLSFLIIIVALLLDNLFAPADTKDKKEPAVVQVDEDAPPRDFEEAEFALPVDQYREKRAFEKYESRLQELEEETGTDYVDHFDGSPEAIRQRENFVRSLEPMYDLPYRGKSIIAKYGKVLETSLGTRYLIVINHTGSQEQAQREWEDYLRQRGDSGKYYIAEYQRVH